MTGHLFHAPYLVAQPVCKRQEDRLILTFGEQCLFVVKRREQDKGKIPYEEPPSQEQEEKDNYNAWSTLMRKRSR